MGDGLRCVRLDDGFSCYVPENSSGSTDEIGFIHAEIFRDECYLRGGVALPTDAVVVDVGANVGLFSLFVKRRCPAARILALEPMPETFRALRANLAGVDGVRAVRQAVGAGAEDAVAFTYFPDLPGNSTRYPGTKELARQHPTAGALLADAREVVLPVRRLSEVLAEAGLPERIDLLKIDVEGAEADVLAGIDDRDWPRVRQVVAEVQGHRGEAEAVLELLRGKGFSADAGATEDELDDLGTRLITARRPPCA
ncbi:MULTISPECIES: FkbM family methyltransferase [unclassified Saccharopolyspora]|uniref:FkbM family methyltransferase n=1 Tax=unclassified Saccharopolyspora TaxID=2646250 RepID=UPI001CD532B4|nr:MULTISPECIES: FkbM family methyltransferase [unclassified Saccharopolyspora]MCA1188424.1 FkbM family methyltransferase [Saccharopolyspora sp. 6T]MCA1192751.1 FkbM family methyltransferase [Saccharopolyspora sp. 6V]MCA1225367.1 FkbM family methyltransferase [Saccharopolyspora sp. 6M]